MGVPPTFGAPSKPPVLRLHPSTLRRLPRLYGRASLPPSGRGRLYLYPSAVAGVLRRALYGAEHCGHPGARGAGVSGFELTEWPLWEASRASHVTLSVKTSPALAS